MKTRRTLCSACQKIGLAFIDRCSIESGAMVLMAELLKIARDDIDHDPKILGTLGYEIAAYIERGRLLQKYFLSDQIGVPDLSEEMVEAEFRKLDAAYGSGAGNDQ